MKSMACISSSVRTACLVTSNSTALNRGTHCYANALRQQYSLHTSFLCKIASKHIYANSLRNFRTVAEQWAAAHQLRKVTVDEKDEEEFMLNLERYLLPKKMMAIKTNNNHSSAAAASSSNLSDFKEPYKLKSLFENEVLKSLYCHLKDAPGNESIEGFVTLLGICVHFGVNPMSPVALQLKEELRGQLSKADVTVPHLCLIGEIVYSLEGKRSEILTQVLSLLHSKVGSDLTPAEAAQIYAFLSLTGDPRHCRSLLTELYRRTERLVHRFQASTVSDILHSLAQLRQKKSIALVLKLNNRVTRLIGSFRDEELIKVLRALSYFGQYDVDLLAALEKQMPCRVPTADPELTSTVMEYCLEAMCRSEPILETVAESFIDNAEKYSTHQIARQIVALGRLNYLPNCSAQLFKKLEGVLETRFSQFQLRDLLDVLHSCIHLERFPLNFVSKVFSHYFLQNLEVAGNGLDKHVMGQLTQLSLSTTLECSTYQGPRLPYHYKVKKFSSPDNFFESPMDPYLFSKVKGPLIELLGGKNFNTRVFTQNGYTIDVEITLDEKGLVLPLSQWENTYRRIALCLDAQDRFCNNSHHLLGKEVTKRRHLERLGYKVVQIPYFEFGGLRSQEERVQYLHRKIFPTVLRFNW